MLNITRRDLEDAFSYINGAHKRASGMKHHGEYVVGTIASQAESGLAALGYGVLEGKFGPIKVGPVSADLLAALLIHGGAFLGVAGSASSHAHNFAQGLMDGHLARVGIGIGTAWGQRKFEVNQGTRVSGRSADRNFERTTSRARMGGPVKPLTAAEVAALAQRRAA